MRKGWVKTTVEKLVNQKIIEKPLDGNHGEIHPKKSDFTESGIPFVMASDLVKGAVNQETCNFISREQADSLRKGFAKNGDVLLSHKGTIGRSAILQTSLDYVVLTPQVTYYRILDNSVLDNRFLYYSFHSPKFQNEIKKIAGAGSTRAYIGITQQLQLHIPIAPIAEQKRIVAILDEAFEGIDRAIANTEKNLANSRELFESYLNAIFTQKGDGWEEKKLKDLINISHGYAFKGSDFEASDDEEKLIVLTPGNYSENGELYFTSKNTKRLTGGSPPDGYLFNIGDLTVVMTDLSSKMKILGKPAFIDRPNILHNQRIGRIIFRDESISPRYLFYFLRTEIFANKIKETATGTMVRHTAPQRILSNKISIPKYFDRQLQITSKLDQVASETQRLETIYRQKLAALNELKQSILQKAFTGALTADTSKTAKQEIAA